MEPIVSREAIAERARQAALAHAAGEPIFNPYPLNSEAAAAFDASLARYLSETIDGAEASA